MIERPWKKFVARLVKESRATVVPVFFEGQNSRLFQWVSRFGDTLRLSLLVKETLRHKGRSVKVHVGPAINYEELEKATGSHSLLDELYLQVHRLSPQSRGQSDEQLLFKKDYQRRHLPCDDPVVIRRGT